MSQKCPRVKKRIECPDCGYPYSEAAYGLDEVRDPGHKPDHAWTCKNWWKAAALYVVAIVYLYLLLIFLSVMI